MKKFKGNIKDNQTKEVITIEAEYETKSEFIKNLIKFCKEFDFEIIEDVKEG